MTDILCSICEKRQAIHTVALCYHDCGLMTVNGICDYCLSWKDYNIGWTKLSGGRWLFVQTFYLSKDLGKRTSYHDDYIMECEHCLEDVFNCSGHWYNHGNSYVCNICWQDIKDNETEDNGGVL